MIPLGHCFYDVPFKKLLILPSSPPRQSPFKHSYCFSFSFLILDFPHKKSHCRSINLFPPVYIKFFSNFEPQYPRMNFLGCFYEIIFPPPASCVRYFRWVWKKWEGVRSITSYYVDLIFFSLQTYFSDIKFCCIFIISVCTFLLSYLWFIFNNFIIGLNLTSKRLCLTCTAGLQVTSPC